MFEGYALEKKCQVQGCRCVRARARARANVINMKELFNFRNAKAVLLLYFFSTSKKPAYEI